MTDLPPSPLNSRPSGQLSPSFELVEPVDWGAWDQTEDGLVALGVVDVAGQSAAVSVVVRSTGEPLVETYWYGGTGELPSWLDHALRAEASVHLDDGAPR